MPEYLTLFCNKQDPALALAIVQELAEGRSDIRVESASSNWTKITITDGTLVLNSRRYEKGGDDFSRMILGLHNYLEKVKTSHTHIQCFVLERAAWCKYSIGVVAEPAFDEDAGHYDYVFGLAEALDAMIWTGNCVVNAEGDTLLDSEGNTEVSQEWVAKQAV